MLLGNYRTAVEMVIHCNLGDIWSSTAEMCSSCILGLDPLNYSAPVLCLSVGCDACIFLAPRWAVESTRKRNPDLPQLACFSVAYCQHPLTQRHCHLEHSPSHSLYCVLQCAHRDAVSFLHKVAHNALNIWCKPQRTAGFNWCTPKQLEGRSICFHREMKAPRVIA